MTPQRLLLAVGVPLGLLIALLSPAWTAYDEFTHFARVVDMAHGNLEPGLTPEGVGSLIPAAYREATAEIIIDHQAGRPPWTPTSVRALLGHRPDGRTVFVDTRPTTASSPLGYLPATVGSFLPVALGAPGVVVLWAGRLASLAAYMLLAAWAVRTATAFRWSLAVAATIPLNLALAASVSPDGLTTAAVLLAVAMWTRVEGGEDVPLPALILSTGMLALAKPPYFLVLSLFVASAVLERTAGRIRAACVAGAALLVGLTTTVANSGDNYQAVTTTMIRRIDYNPERQMDHLLGDMPGFLWATVDTWLTEYRFYVQGWFRQLGFWEADMAPVVPWALVAILAVSLLALDGDDMKRLSGVRRAAIALGVAGLVIAIYAASFVYFTDRPDYDQIGLQMARYSAPLAVLAFIAWSPRALVGPARRLGRRLAVVGVVGVPMVAVGASVVTWLWTGANTELG